MRPTLWIAALAVAVTLSSACAADASSALAPEGSAEAQVWFKRALALDLGAGGGARRHSGVRRNAPCSRGAEMVILSSGTRRPGVCCAPSKGISAP
jgi:hypothetical protein